MKRIKNLQSLLITIVAVSSLFCLSTYAGAVQTGNDKVKTFRARYIMVFPKDRLLRRVEYGVSFVLPDRLEFSEDGEVLVKIIGGTFYLKNSNDSWSAVTEETYKELSKVNMLTDLVNETPNPPNYKTRKFYLKQRRWLNHMQCKILRLRMSSASEDLYYVADRWESVRDNFIRRVIVRGYAEGARTPDFVMIVKMYDHNALIKIDPPKL